MRTLNGVLIVAMMIVFAGPCAALAGGKKASSGNVNLNDVTVKKPTDKASPNKTVVRGKHFNSAIMQTRKSADPNR